MSHETDVAHSAYMIGKARARIRHQKYELQKISSTSDARRVALGKNIISLMEERLAILFREHERLAQ